MSREYAIKRMTRREKSRLISEYREKRIMETIASSTTVRVKE